MRDPPALDGKTPHEVYHDVLPACQRPRYEPRARWPRSAPCASPPTLVAGHCGAHIRLDVRYHRDRKHLARVARFGFVPPPPPGRGHRRTVFAVRCEHTVKAGEVEAGLGHRKRLRNYIFPRFFITLMMTPSLIDIDRVHHDFELIEKSDQPPALAGAYSGLGGKRSDTEGVL